jgi:hypothetical protein
VFRASPFVPRADKLAECDESLSLIAADVEQLTEELDRVRAGASPLVLWLAERDALLADKELELARLENDRLRALRRAEDATASLRGARDLLEEHDDRDASATRELEELRRALAERDRRVEDAERERLRADETLAEQRVTVAAQANAVDDQAATPGHVLFVPFAEGYRLVVSDESCPCPGDVVDAEGRSFVVARVGRSPFPADARPCAFLQIRLNLP